MTSEEFGQDLEHVEVLQKKFDEFQKVKNFLSLIFFFPDYLNLYYNSVCLFIYMLFSSHTYTSEILVHLINWDILLHGYCCLKSNTVFNFNGIALC